MLSNFKSLLSNKPAQASEARKPAERMPQDEGLSYRREMLYQSIRESMLAMEVLSNMYKFKVVNVDQQHNTFIAMIEVSKLFEAKWRGATASFAQIEQRMMTGAMNRANVALQAVFWRVDETVDAFVMPARAGEGEGTSGAGLRKREIPGDVSNASIRLARRQATNMPDDEQQAFLAATKRKTRPADAQPDNPTSPSTQETRSEIGGTQYGPL